MSSSAFPLSHYRFVPKAVAERAHWEGVRAEARFAPLFEALEKRCAEAPAKPAMPTASDYLAARRSNDRGRLDRHWHTNRTILASLALRRCVLGLDKDDPDDRLLDWLWAFLNESTWAVSAHLPNRDLPAAGQPVLDLAACEMAAFLAELREVLRPWLDAQSATLADSILYEVTERVLTPYGNGETVWWQDRKDNHLNNWLGVCAGSILAACESLAAQGQPCPEARRRALEGLRLFVEKSFTEHGECDEGLGYWNYGVGFACLGWSRLARKEFEAHLDVERFRLIADYPRRIHLCGDWFFSGNDGGLRGRAALEFIPWLAAAAENRWLAQWAARRAQPFSMRHFGQLLRVLAAPDFSVLSKEPEDETAADGAKPQFIEDQQAAILRAPTSMGELLACLSGGDNAERHNHNDLGHFVIFHNEKLIVPDLGAPVYQSDFFGPKRYQYLSASSRGHCCPLIEEIEQRAGKEAAGKIVSWTPDAEAPKLVLDLSAAYPPEAGLVRWTRSLECRRGGDSAPAQMVIADTFQTKRGGRKIVLPVWSLEDFHEESQHPEGGGVRLKLGTLFCELSPAPVAVGRDVYDADEHLLRNFTGKKLFRVTPVYRTNGKGELNVETRFWMAGY